MPDIIHPAQTGDKRLLSRVTGVIASGMLALTLALGVDAAALTHAFADVRTDDVILGESVAVRGPKMSTCPSIAAEYAMLIDSEGEVYFERNIDTRTHIASVTKIMTALVAMEYVPLNTRITVSEYAARVGGSTAGLKAGDIMTLDTALKALMIPSGNDAAVAIAESVGPIIQRAVSDSISSLNGDRNDQTGATIGEQELEDIKAFASSLETLSAEQAFVAAMNAKAKSIGMTDTLFANSHGLDTESHNNEMYSTARDVAAMCYYAMQNETFRSVVAMGETDIEVMRDGVKTTVKLIPTDILIGAYDGACGIKTGFTEQAGECFAGACLREGTYLYAIILHSTTDQQRFEDAVTLYDWVYNNQIDYKLAHSPESVDMRTDSGREEVPLVAKVALPDWIDKTVDATFADPEASIEVFGLNGNVSQEYSFDPPGGTVKTGDVIGRATFYQDNEVVATMDVVAAETVEGPNFFESAGIWWDRLWRGFSGEASEAQTVIYNETPLIFDKTA